MLYIKVMLSCEHNYYACPDNGELHAQDFVAFVDLAAGFFTRYCNLRLKLYSTTMHLSIPWSPTSVSVAESEVIMLWVQPFQPQCRSSHCIVSLQQATMSRIGNEIIPTSEQNCCSHKDRMRPTAVGLELSNQTSKHLQ